MADKTLSPDEINILLKQEAASILDFCCGPISRVAQIPNLRTWVIGGQPESVADHSFGVLLFALAIHQLCKARDIAPICNIDGTRIALQALTNSALAFNNLYAVEFPDSPTLASMQRDSAVMVVKAVTLPLAPGIAEGFNEAWVNQLTNDKNPVSALVNVAELGYSILVSLNIATAGNTSGRLLCRRFLWELWMLSKRLDEGLAAIAMGIVNTVCELLGIVPEELDDDART